jgi:glycosyltransferase involved in cell wall biosynthesis
MKALLITYHFPPMLGCCSLRMGALAGFLAEKGWECHILTANIQSGDPTYTLDSQIASRRVPWHVYPISEGSFGNVVKRLRKTRFGPDAPTTAKEKAMVGNRQPSRVSNLLKAMAFPDSKAGWIPKAQRQVNQLLRKHRFDLIYSFGYPWSSHFVGYMAHRRTKSPWIMDYADPWTLNPDNRNFPFWRNTLDRWTESRLLRRASAVVVATPESRTFLGELFGTSVMARTHVARVAQFPAREYQSATNTFPEHFQIAFTGLFDKTRSPYPFYDAMTSFVGWGDVRACLAGLVDDQFQDYSRTLGLESLVRHLGRLPRANTIELQRTSHVLLSFGWPGGLQVPCKLYEYFAARRPLLHVAGDDRDPAADLVRRYKRGLVVPNDAQAVAKALRSLHELWAAGKLEERFDLSPLDEFCLPGSLGGLEEAINATVAGGSETDAVPVADPVVRHFQAQT